MNPPRYRKLKDFLGRLAPADASGSTRRSDTKGAAERVVDALLATYDRLEKQPRRDLAALLPTGTTLANATIPDWIEGPKGAASAARRGIEAWHGSPNKFDEFAGEGPFFFTNKRELAETYKKRRGPWVSDSPDASLKRVELMLDNPLTVDALNSKWDNIPVPWAEWKPKVFGNLPGDAWNTQRIADRAKELGHDGVVINNVVDPAFGEQRVKSTVYAVFDPRRIKILETLAALGIVSAQNELAQMRQQGPNGG